MAEMVQAKGDAVPDDKDKGDGIKDNLRDEFDEAAGEDEKGKKEQSGGSDVKDKLSDEFNKATGKDKKDKDS